MLDVFGCHRDRSPSDVLASIHTAIVSRLRSVRVVAMGLLVPDIQSCDGDKLTNYPRMQEVAPFWS